MATQIVPAPVSAERTTAPLPAPAPVWPAYTFADAVADCPAHRAQHEEAEARYAAYGESIRRRDRIQLGLRGARSRAVTA